MAIAQSLYPNGTTSNSGVTSVDPGGPGGFAAPLGDADSATYDEFASGGGTLVETLDDYTIPAGDMIKSMRAVLNLRTVDVGGAAQIVINLNDGANPPYNVWNANTFAQTGSVRIQAGPYVYGTPDGAAFTQALINAMKLAIVTNNPVGGGTPTRVRFYEARVDLVTLAQPTIGTIGPAGSIIASQPTITWVFTGDFSVGTSGAREPQTYYRAKVFREADAAAGGFNPDTSTLAVWDSGAVASASASVQVGSKLDPGDYRLYVKAAQIRKHWSAYAYSSITIVNLPNVPSLTSPTSGSVVDTNAGFRAAWTYSHPDGTAEAKWALRRATDGGSYEYWRESDTSWQATIQWNVAAAVFKDFASGDWPNNHVYAWSVAVEDALGADSAFASDSTITATAAPTANVTAPSGTVTTTTRPAITWSFADGASRPQSAYQVKVFLTSDPDAPDGGSPVFDSGIRAGSAGTISTGLDFPPDGTSYTAYVKVLAGTQWSAWDSSTFNCTITAPLIPVSITAVEQTASNSVLVTVTGSVEASYTALRTIVERHNPDGTWTQVRGAGALVPNGSHVATVVDYECPPRTSTVYRARIFGTLTGGGIVAGTNRSATAVTLSPTSWWLKDVLDNSRNAALPIGDGLVVTNPVAAGVFDTYGDAAVVVSEATPRAARMTLKIWTKSAAVKAAVDGLLDQTRVLLVQDVLNQQWYVQLAGDVPWTFLRAISSSMPREHAYSIDVPVVVVDVPAVS